MSDAGATFREVFGYSAVGIWAAPGRVNLIGEHTDYNEGLVLPFAIAQSTHAAIAPRNDGWIRMYSAHSPGVVVELDAGRLAPGAPAGWAAYVAGVPWALETDLGFDVAIESSVPIGSGLSSSAALMCAVGLGIDELFDLGFSRRELAKRTQRTENEFVGAPTGGMDQIASLLGTSGHAILYDVRADTTEQVPFDPVSAGLEVLVVDSMVRHGHAGGEYRERRADCEESARRLGVSSLREISRDELDDALDRLADARLVKRTRHIVTENQRVLDVADALGDHDWARAARLLNEAHASYRDDFEASCIEVDLAVVSLLENGALGARLTGGGFGGAAIALLTPEAIDDAVAAVQTAYVERGFDPATVFTVVPSAGARRIA